MQPGLEYQHLARAILAWEGGDSLEADALQRTADRVFGALLQALARLIGVTGSVALLVRAAHLLRDEFPFLGPLQLGTTPEACRQALRQALPTAAPESARDGVAALLASCLRLLASFIGDDLVLILAREIWPDLPATPESPAGGGASDD
jgi:hypothetical protein